MLRDSTAAHWSHIEQLEENKDQLNDELISTYINSDFLARNRRMQRDLIEYTLTCKYELKFDSKIDTSFTGDFLKYLPSKTSSKFNLPYWNSTSRIPWQSWNEGDFKNKSGTISEWAFRIESPHFMDPFIFPRDYLDYLMSSPDRDLPYSKLVHKNYLMLDIPDFYFVNVRFSKSMTQAFFENGVNRASIFRESLLLNPAFIESYENDIIFLWKLYLLKILYEEEDETLKCSDGSCEPDWDSARVVNYLEQASTKNPELYTSYYELILWQKFKPFNFKVISRKKQSMTIAFNSEDESDEVKSYQVKFNILQPYSFKVEEM